MKQVCVLLFLILVTAPLFNIAARCPAPSGGRPLWISESRLPQNQADSYFEVIRSDGRTLSEARQNASAEIVRRRSAHTGGRVTLQHGSGGTIFLTENDLWIRHRIWCEFIEQARCGNFNIWQLVQVARNPDEEPQEIHRRYFSRLQSAENRARFFSSFVPGMQQIRRSSTAQGVFFIAGAVVGTTGIFVSEGIRADNVAKANRERVNMARRQNYINNANTARNLKNGLIVGTAGLYVWNVIDGLVGRRTNNFDSRVVQTITPYFDFRASKSGVLFSWDF